MVSEGENTATYVLLALYVFAMIIVTIIANRQNAAAAANAANENDIKNHFLASKQFGVVVLFLTTFASIFSGYTVAGVPNEAGANGFSAIRWIGSTGMVSVSFLVLFPRLRRISMIREYVSPGDFIFDRYRLKVMSVLNALLLCIPQLLYVTVQFHALGATLDFFTGGELPFNTVVVVSACLMLIFEALGGLRTVAYTDAVQASVMVIVFLCFPFILATMYHGGFIGMVVNSDDLPCANDRSFTATNSTDIVESGCLNYEQGTTGIDEYFLRSPSSITITNYILFSISLMSFGLNPHVMQRVMAASNDGQVRLVMIAMSLTPFICQLPGVFTGIAFLSNKNNLPFPFGYYPAFWSTLGVFQNEGGFREAVAYIAMLGAVAGIMSTADSALIGVSNTFVVDVFKNWLTPNLSPKHIVYIGKVISFTTVAIAVGVAINMEAQSEKTGEPVDYGNLLGLQQSILWQAFPAYVCGMYTNVRGKTMLSGIIAGLVINFGLLIADVSSENGLIEGVDGSWFVLVSVACNLCVCGVMHLVVGGVKVDADDTADFVVSADAENGYKDLKALSIGNVRQIMGGIDEPISKYNGVFVYGVAVCVWIAAFHMIGEVDPALVDALGEEAVSKLSYNGYVRNVIGGMPDWAFASILWFVAATCCSITSSWLWSTDTIKEKMTEMVSPASPQSAESPKSNDEEDGVLTTTDI